MKPLYHIKKCTCCGYKVAGNSYRLEYSNLPCGCGCYKYDFANGLDFLKYNFNIMDYYVEDKDTDVDMADLQQKNGKLEKVGGVVKQNKSNKLIGLIKLILFCVLLILLPILCLLYLSVVFNLSVILTLIVCILYVLFWCYEFRAMYINTILLQRL